MPKSNLGSLVAVPRAPARVLSNGKLKQAKPPLRVTQPQQLLGPERPKLLEPFGSQVYYSSPRDQSTTLVQKWNAHRYPQARRPAVLLTRGTEPRSSSRVSKFQSDPTRGRAVADARRMDASARSKQTHRLPWEASMMPPLQHAMTRT